LHHVKQSPPAATSAAHAIYQSLPSARDTG